MSEFSHDKKQRLVVTKHALVTSAVLFIGYLVILLVYMNYTYMPEMYKQVMFTFFKATHYAVALVLIYNLFQLIILGAILIFLNKTVNGSTRELTSNQLKLYRFVFHFPDYNVINFVLFGLISLSGFVTFVPLFIDGILAILSAGLINKSKARLQNGMAELGVLGNNHLSKEITKIIYPNVKK